MPPYHLAKFAIDQPNLWAPLLLGACRIACAAGPSEASTFEVSLLSSESGELEREGFEIVHAAGGDLENLQGFDRLDAGSKEDLLHLAAACVVATILRTKLLLRVGRVARRGAWLDFHLESEDGSDAGVLAAFGTMDEDTTHALASVARHVEGAPGGRKIAGAVAFGGKKAAIRVLI